MTPPVANPPPPSKEAPLEGVVERISYVNEENGWSVIRLHLPATNRLITAVGRLLGVQPGENLRLSGRWVTDRKFGEQFEVESYLAIQPATLVGLEKYLGSGLVRGLGPVMAARLVKRFGLESLEVIEHQPWRLTHVKGIGPKRKAQILTAWSEHKAIKEVMLFLQTHGISPTYAVKICKRYGQQAIAVVKENPYQLAVEVSGIGFKIADKIAANLGIAGSAPQRVEAGALFVLDQAGDEGHVFIPQDELIARAAEMLAVEVSAVELALEQLAAKSLVRIEDAAAGPAVYLTALYTAEKGVAQRLRHLCAAPLPPLAVDLEGAIAWFERQHQLQLADQQKAVIHQALKEKVLVITGGPGTGKTTIVNGIIQIFSQKGRRILLCAPTGRAAKRMTEASGQEAKTIHRLLEFNPQHQRFERDQEYPLEADLLIVDEMSMVDTVLCYHLLKAVPASCQLILVGDVDQLPSVGPGNVLQELIRSGVVAVVTLTEIFRQAQQSLIVVNAHRLNQGEPLLEQPEDKTADFFFIEREAPEQVLATIKELVARRIPQRFGVDSLHEIQVLTPMHKGLLGSKNLNLELQGLLNPTGETLVRGSRLYRVGDKVMQIRNNYTLDVYNGDLGVISHIDGVDQQLGVRFEDREVTYEAADLDELVLGYACSIHKSQGSEYPVVVIPLHTQHYVMLQRNLLYTAITRGRRLVCMVGSRRALSIAIHNDHVHRRFTRLAETLAAH